MATYTPNYGLHQWAPEDSFLRTDFNTDLSKIDTALKNIASLASNKVNIVTGTYTGNGAASQDITLSLVPRVVMVRPQNTATQPTDRRGYTGFASQEVNATYFGSDTVQLTDTGFRVFYDNKDNGILMTNSNSMVYLFLAIF